MMPKEKKIRDIIAQMKKTSKGRAILKLICWLIFFILVFVFCAVTSSLTGGNNSNIKRPAPSNNNASSDNVSDIKTIVGSEVDILSSSDLDNISNMLNASSTYKYTIDIKEQKFIFSGNKTLKEDVGYKESSTGVIKYVIDETGIYEETTLDKKLITNLYQGLNENYLNITKLFNGFKNVEFRKNIEASSLNMIYEAIQGNIKYRLEIDDVAHKIVIDIKTQNENYNLVYMLN